MSLGVKYVRRALLLLLTLTGAVLTQNVEAASCKTQSQMTAAERDTLSSAARTFVGEVRSGDIQALQANTIPALASDFGSIADSIGRLKPLMQDAVITVESLYFLDASTESAGAPRTDFYCGTPVVVLNFTDIPPGTYALTILHVTGIPKPQQISLILSEVSGHGWMLAGFFNKPLIVAGHDGLWYWVSAREYAKKNMNWNASFYYRTAAYLLAPVPFLSSPHLEKLRHEANLVHADALFGDKPIMLHAHGSAFQVTRIDTTTALGALDLEVHYNPDAEQAAHLRDLPAARRQVTEVMKALLALYPELQGAFHGIWVYADEGAVSAFSLELPMDQIVPTTKP